MIGITANARWTQNGVTVAGGYGPGFASHQLFWPCGIIVDDNQTIFIADSENHRVMRWIENDERGRIVAGGNNLGRQLDQLDRPTDVLIDIDNNSLIVCDRDNLRVVRWPLWNSTAEPEVLIENTACNGLAMDNRGYLYVSDYKNHDVRRYKFGDKVGTVVAGGHGQGDRVEQLNGPTYLFVDRYQAVYVSDNGNDRVMRWDKGAKRGIVVAGGRGRGSDTTKLYWPNGLLVDSSGTLYIADSGNNRILRWRQGETEGDVILGGNGCGSKPNQFNYLKGLSFDQYGNLYVADYWNHRVQRFSLV